MPVPACGSRRAREGASIEEEMSPRVRRNPLEGGVSPRARRNLLEGASDWATPVGRGGHRNVGRAPCVRLSERCVLFLFFAGFKHDSPGFLGTLRVVPDGSPRASAGMPARLPQMLKPTDGTSFPPGC
jgi:hypothetical protein